jgi:hypothetical protein
MTTNAISTVGAQFKRGDGESNEVFTALAEVNSITGPNKTRETIEVTSLDSTGGYDEFIPSFRNPGEYVLNMNWTRDGYDTLNDDFEIETVKNYRVVYPDTTETTYDFAGYVTAVNRGLPLKDKATMDVTVKVTGQETMGS